MHRKAAYEDPPGQSNGRTSGVATSQQHRRSCPVSPPRWSPSQETPAAPPSAAEPGIQAGEPQQPPWARKQTAQRQAAHTRRTLKGKPVVVLMCHVRVRSSHRVNVCRIASRSRHEGCCGRRSRLSAWWRRAKIAAWTRSCRSSLVRMLLTWVLTVCSPIASSRLICRLLRPRAMRRRTSRSRGESGSGGWWPAQRLSEAGQQVRAEGGGAVCGVTDGLDDVLGRGGLEQVGGGTAL